MSGIFRHSTFTSSSPLNDSTHCNNRRYAFSAFCTSPGTLRDVTMENSYGVGCRSPLQQHPGGSSPPTFSSHGTRSIREFEEQMSNLRKENFNLKLRLYFIEESIPSYHPKQQQHQNQNNQQQGHEGSGGDNCGHENIMKQLIDTKVEREVLRKELQEKQEILKEAAQAMTQMENIQKDTETRYNEIIENLQQRIQQLEMDHDVTSGVNPATFNSAVMSDITGHSDVSSNYTSINAIQKIRELEGLLKQSEIKLVELQSENIKLEDTLSKRNATISEYEEKVKDLVFKNSELLETIETKDKEIVTAECLIRSIRLTNEDLKTDNENLITALRETQENYQKEAKYVKTYENQVREQQDTLDRMQSAISIKTANAARLLERIQEYERIVTRINVERNIFKRENRFFRTIINKLEAASGTTPTPASTLTLTSMPMLKTKRKSKELVTFKNDGTFQQHIDQQLTSNGTKNNNDDNKSNISVYYTINTNNRNSKINNNSDDNQSNQQQPNKHAINTSNGNNKIHINNDHNKSAGTSNRNRTDRCDHFYYKLFNEFVERGRLSKKCKCCRSCCKSTITPGKNAASASSGLVVEAGTANTGAISAMAAAPNDRIQSEYKCKKLSVNISTVSTAAAASASNSGTVAAAAVTSATAIGSFHCLATSAAPVQDRHYKINDDNSLPNPNQLFEDYLQSSTIHFIKRDATFTDYNKNNHTRKMMISDDSDGDLSATLKMATSSTPATKDLSKRRYSMKDNHLSCSSLHKSSSLSIIRRPQSVSSTSLISSNSSVSGVSCYLCDLPEANETDT